MPTSRHCFFVFAFSKIQYYSNDKNNDKREAKLRKVNEHLLDKCRQKNVLV